MDNKKYQIFISSTYEDLKPHRLKVRDTILSMLHFPVGMELFGAADETQWEIIKKTIDSSDYYVLIVGNRYGSIIQAGENGEDGENAEYAGFSYTEKEYDYAASVKIPILAFLSSKDVKASVDDIENDETRNKLVAFREKVKSKLVDFWSNEDDLAAKVSTALYKQMFNTPRPSWIRGDSIDIAKSLKAIVDLTAQVKSLQEENQRLKSKVTERSPKITLDIKVIGMVRNSDNSAKINDVDDVDNVNDVNGINDVVSIDNSEKHITIHKKQIPESSIAEKVQPLTQESVPVHLKNEISTKDIEIYNKQLPSKKEVAAYDKAVKKYKETYNNGILFKFELSNIGTVSATKVIVDLDFPDELLVMEKATAENIACPEYPKLPKDPIAEAERRRKITSEGKNLTDNFFFKQDNPYTVATTTASFAVMKPHIPALSTLANFSNDAGIDINGREVHIWRNSLMHTRMWTTEEICIVPLNVGQFVVKASYMCEEYARPVEEEIIFDVTEAEE